MMIILKLNKLEVIMNGLNQVKYVNYYLIQNIKQVIKKKMDNLIIIHHQVLLKKVILMISKI